MKKKSDKKKKKQNWQGMRAMHLEEESLYVSKTLSNSFIRNFLLSSVSSGSSELNGR